MRGLRRRRRAPPATPAPGIQIAREYKSIEVLAGEKREVLRLVCPCGYTIDWRLKRHAKLSDDEMMLHLLDEHPEQLTYGRCGECAAITDQLRIVTEFGTGWLCERHAPGPQELGFDPPDAEHPYSELRGIEHHRGT
jgi:hypothetical protein